MKNSALLLAAHFPRAASAQTLLNVDFGVGTLATGNSGGGRSTGSSLEL